MKSQSELLVQQAIDAWNTYIGRVNKLIDSLTDEQLQREFAPGRNTGTYLLGHLASVHDGMIPLLGFGTRLHPELEEIFVRNPDKTLEKPSPQVIRQTWKDVNAALAGYFKDQTVDNWLQRHSAVSEEDFKKEPHRNKLNVLLNRTNHMASHYGQMIFLGKQNLD